MKLSKLERYQRFTFIGKDKIYQYRGIEDRAFVYFIVSKKKYNKVYRVFKDIDVKIID